MYRSATMKTKDDPEKKVADLRKNVSKKLFAGMLKRSSTQEGPDKKVSMSKTKVNTSGSYDFRDKDVSRLSVVKKKGIVDKPITEKKDSVFNELGKIPLTNRKIVGNATEMIPQEKLKVNKQHQNRVNKILGK